MSAETTASEVISMSVFSTASRSIVVWVLWTTPRRCHRRFPSTNGVSFNTPCTVAGSAIAGELTGATNAIKIVNPGDDHSVFVNDLTDTDRDRVIAALERWLQLEID